MLLKCQQSAFMAITAVYPHWSADTSHLFKNVNVFNKKKKAQQSDHRTVWILCPHHHKPAFSATTSACCILDTCWLLRPIPTRIVTGELVRRADEKCPSRRVRVVAWALWRKAALHKRWSPKRRSFLRWHAHSGSSLRDKCPLTFGGMELHEEQMQQHELSDFCPHL